MAEVTGLTAARQLEIENNSIVDAHLSGTDLILTTHGNVDINVGNIKGEDGEDGEDGGQGPMGPAGPSKNPVLNRGFFPFYKRWLANQEVDVVLWGSSSHEGAGKPDSVSRAFNILTEKLRDYLYEGGDYDRGRGYIPAYYRVPLSDSPIRGGNSSEVGNEGGLGGKSVSLGDARGGVDTGGYLDFGDLDFGDQTSFDIIFTKRSYFFTGAPIKVYVDDVFVDTVVTSNSGSEIEHGATHTVTITPGVHNIKLKNEATSATAARIEGLIHKTRDKGLTVYDNTWSGSSLSSYLEGTQSPKVLQALLNVTPRSALHIIGLGTNDMVGGVGGVDVFGTRLQTVFTMMSVDQDEVQSPPGVIFFMQGERIEDAAANNAVHTLYTDKLYEVAAEFPNVTIVEEKDLWTPMPGSNLTEQNPVGWLADTVHHSALAAKVMANHAFETFTPADTGANVSGGGGSPIDAWPVGSIFMSMVSTDPNMLLGGGTWAAWGTGRVPVAVDPIDADFNAAGKTGGSKTHTLTADEMPAHNHNLPFLYHVAGTGEAYFESGTDRYRTNITGNATTQTGGDQPHTIVQPYITCYMWQRTS